MTKKMTKQVWLYALIALFVCAAIVGVAVAFTSTASAETTLNSGKLSSDVTVTYNVAGGWEISITDGTLALEPDVESTIKVEVKSAVLDPGQALSVAIHSDNYNSGWKLKNSDDELSYSIKKGEQEVADNEKIIKNVDGDSNLGTDGTAELTVKLEQTEADGARYKGEYSDTLTFTVSTVKEA